MKKSRTKLHESSTNKTKRISAASSMKDLHWLPTRYRCCFKLLTIVYKSVHGVGPAYLSDRLKITKNTRNTSLAQSTTLYLVVPFNKTRRVADRGFCYVAVQHWNALANYIHIASNLQEFQKLSKTYFFNIVYH